MKYGIIILLVIAVLIIVFLRVKSDFSPTILSDVESMLRSGKSHKEVMDYLAQNNIPLNDAVDALNAAQRKIGD